MGEREAAAEAAVVRQQGTWMFLAAAINSGLGFLFWAIAVNAFPSAEVGLAGAVVSLASLGTSMAMLGLDNGLVRFASKSERPRLLVGRLGILTLVGGLLVSIPLAYGVFGSGAVPDPWPIVALAATLTIAQLWFQLTDSSMLAAGRNELIAGRSLVFGVGKIVLILALVSLGVIGLLVAYTAPLLLVVAIGFALTGYLWPRTQAGGVRLRLRDFASLSLGNYVSGLVWFLPNRLAPSLMLVFLGADAAAYFFLALTIAEVLNYIPEAVGKSVFAHGSRVDGVSSALMSSLRRWLAVIMIPLVALGIVLSEFGLDLLGGPEYAAHALALQLFLVAVLPRTGLQVLKAQFNVEKRAGALVALGVATGLTTLAVLIVGLALSWPLDLLAAAWIVGGLAGLAVGSWLGRWRLHPARGTPRP